MIGKEWKNIRHILSNILNVLLCPKIEISSLKPFCWENKDIFLKTANSNLFVGQSYILSSIDIFIKQNFLLKVYSLHIHAEIYILNKCILWAKLCKAFLSASSHKYLFKKYLQSHWYWSCRHIQSTLLSKLLCLQEWKY